MIGFLKTVTNSIKHWYLPLIVGILFIIAGIYTFISPGVSFIALSLLFSISFLVSGLVEIIFSISNRKEVDNWGWTLVFGILTFLIGLLLVTNLDISAITLAYYVGFLILFRSIMGISYSIDIKNYGVSGWKTLLIFGIIGVVISFILLWNPELAGLAIVFWLGLTIISGGILSIIVSVELKKIKSLSNKISKELKDKIETLRRDYQEEIDLY